ncbi:UPF0764 protein C16orf89 [Plecturocebus cupreus]
MSWETHLSNGVSGRGRKDSLGDKLYVKSMKAGTISVQFTTKSPQLAHCHTQNGHLGIRAGVSLCCLVSNTVDSWPQMVVPPQPPTTRSGSMAQAGVQWHNLGSLQLPLPGLKPSSHLSLLNSWDYSCASPYLANFRSFCRNWVLPFSLGWSQTVELKPSTLLQLPKVLGLQA